MRWFLITVLALAGCAQIMTGPNSECIRICGKDHYQCSTARPDEPRRAQLFTEKDDRGPATAFKVEYSGVVCTFIYTNLIEPKLNFSIGNRNEPVVPKVPAALPETE